MSYSLSWLPSVLKSAGLEFIEVEGWLNRGHGDFGIPKGILCHHTGGPRKGDIEDLNVLVKGRHDLKGPLCNLGLGRRGKFYVIAAGKAWHSGLGFWQGVTNGNSQLIGIEAENVGDKTDPWPEKQLIAFKKGCAAILKHIGANPIMCAGHKEFALPHGRKNDPSFDMNKFRDEIKNLMEQKGDIPNNTTPKV